MAIKRLRLVNSEAVTEAGDDTTNFTASLSRSGSSVVIIAKTSQLGMRLAERSRPCTAWEYHGCYQYVVNLGGRHFTRARFSYFTRCIDSRNLFVVEAYLA